MELSTDISSARTRAGFICSKYLLSSGVLLLEDKQVKANPPYAEANPGNLNLKINNKELFAVSFFHIPDQ